MSTDFSKLKKLNAKGAPPELTDAPDVIAENPREEPVEMKNLQFKIPADVFTEFGAQAGLEFDYKHGAKKKLFLKVWAEYKARL